MMSNFASPSANPRLEKEWSSGEKFLAAANEKKEALGYSLSPHLQELIVELVAVERRADYLYQQIAEEIKPLTRTPSQFENYFNTYLKDFLATQWGQRDYGIFKSTITTNKEDENLKNALTKRMQRYRARLRETRFPFLADLRKFKARAIKLEKEFAKLNLTEEEIVKQVEEEKVEDKNGKSKVHKAEEAPEKDKQGKLDRNAAEKVARFIWKNLEDAVQTVCETGSVSSVGSGGGDDIERFTGDVVLVLDCLIRQMTLHYDDDDDVVDEVEEDL